MLNVKMLCMCFLALKNASDRVPRKVLEWAMRKEAIQEVMVTLVMSLYEGAKTRVRVDYELSTGFQVKVGRCQESVLSFFCSCGSCCH